ncbi:phage minor capsid protein [Streptococcus fryi]
MTKTKKRPTINEQQLSLHMQGVSDIYAKMQQELFDSMIKRLKERGNADLQRNPYIWQLEKLNDMYMLNEENLKIIIERTGIAESLLRKVIENEGLKVYQDTKQQLEEDLKQNPSGVVTNGVTSALEAYTQQAISDLNLINTTLPKSVQAVFKSVVEQTVAQVVSGTKTSDRALNDTIMSWQKKGFTGFTDSAGREWRADSYARAIIKTTTYRVYNDMRTRPAEELGIDTFYYSIKSSARAACAPLQGKIVTKGQGRVVNGVTIHSLLDYGYGTAGGCLGVHCGHYLTPFIVGVNELPDLPEHLKDLTPEQAEENARIEAKQRALERTVRHHKERLHYAKTMGDSELEMWEKLQVRKNQGKLRNLVASHDFLNRDYSRERFAGHIVHKTKEVVSETVRKTAQEYKSLVELLGNNAPRQTHEENIVFK